MASAPCAERKYPETLSFGMRISRSAGLGCCRRGREPVLFGHREKDTACLRYPRCTKNSGEPRQYQIYSAVFIEKINQPKKIACGRQCD